MRGYVPNSDNQFIDSERASSDDRRTSIERGLKEGHGATATFDLCHYE